MNTLELQKQANEIRKGIIAAVHSAKSGHPGGSLSAADIFTYLYFEEMNIDPKNPKMEDRDRFVLSKGHVAPGLYAALAHRGYFPVEDLTTLRHVGSYLQIDAAISEICDPEPLDKKFEAFRFHTITIDGNDFEQIAKAFEEARATKGMPTAIIAKTVKGKGVSFMENAVNWHGVAPNDEQFEIAMQELEKAGEALCQK